MPIIFTEGPIEVLVLIQAGAFPIGLMGAWAAATSKRKAAPPAPLELDQFESADDKKLHDELARNFRWLRRPVYLCFDADTLKNENIRHAEIRLAFLLRSFGADVYQLSTWPLAEGKGVDDYLAAKAGTDPEKQRETFAGLIEIAVPFIETLDHHDIDAAKETAQARRSPLKRSGKTTLLELIYDLCNRPIPASNISGLFTGRSRMIACFRLLRFGGLSGKKFRLFSLEFRVKFREPPPQASVIAYGDEGAMPQVRGIRRF